MLLDILKFLMLLKIYLCHSYALNITNWSQCRDMENLRLTTNIGVLTTPSVIACAVECANIPPCMSYSYHAGNNTCLLYAIPFTNGTLGTVSENGWNSYNLMCDNSTTALGYFYKRNLNMCYHFESEEMKNVTEAILFCSVGGRMLRVDTIEKQTHMAEFLTSRPSSTIYIGGLSEHRDNSFVYEDETPLTFFFWFPGNPRKDISIRIPHNFNFEFKWRNSPGYRRRQFLCEITL